MRNVGYDGADCFDPSGKSDDAHLAPLDPGSTEYLLVRAALCAGFYPNVTSIQTRSQRHTFVNNRGAEVQLHRSSVNVGCKQYAGQWLVHTDAMKFAKVNVLGSTVVGDAFVLLFCNSLQDNGAQLQMDRWAGNLLKSSSRTVVQEAFHLRTNILSALKMALQQHNLSQFPYDLVLRMVKFLKSSDAALFFNVEATREKRSLEDPCGRSPKSQKVASAGTNDRVQSVSIWDQDLSSTHIFTEALLQASKVMQSGGAQAVPMETSEEVPHNDVAPADSQTEPDDAITYEEVSDCIVDLQYAQLLDPDTLRMWVTQGQDSQEFRELLGFCSTELTGSGIAEPFYSGCVTLFQGLGCSLDLHNLSDCPATRLMALEWVLAEVLASRITETRIMEGLLPSPVPEPPPPSSSGSAIASVCSIAAALNCAVPKAADGAVPPLRPLLVPALDLCSRFGAGSLRAVTDTEGLTAVQMQTLVAINSALHKDYTLRRRTSIARLKVTLEVL